MTDGGGTAPAPGGSPPGAASAPLVSVGLPTYNREALLRRAVDAILGQDHPAIELLVSDNASTDGTEAYCREVAARDPRVRYVRQPRNVGATANYRDVQRRATGAYYMNMADDDVPAPNYVSACVRELEADPGRAVVLGRPLMVREDGTAHEGARCDVVAARGADRVVAYYATVSENVAFLGVMRRDVVERTPAAPNTMGGDWVYIAAIAFQGSILTIDGTWLRKQAGGASQSTRQIARSLGLPWIQGVLPVESILLAAFRDIVWRSPVYAPLGAFGRLVLGVRVAWTLLARFRGLPLLRRLRLAPRRTP